MSVQSQGATRRRDPENSLPFMIVPLPCLRCGRLTVPITPLLFLVGRGASTFICRSCDAQHYLSVTPQRDAFAVCFQRYTLRHPLEYYDEGELPPIVTLHTGGHSAAGSNDDMIAGPIVVYPRKKRFSRSEVEAIWRSSKGRCHICSQRWPLDRRGARGWHIDHVIPHIGGGRKVEKLPNFRVACARCNLKKGKGFTEASIRRGLCRLIELLARDSRDFENQLTTGLRQTFVPPPYGRDSAAQPERSADK